MVRIPAEGALLPCNNIPFPTKYHRRQHKHRLQSPYVNSPAIASWSITTGNSLVFSSKEQDMLYLTSSYTRKFFGYLKSSHSQREQYSEFNKALNLSETFEGKGDYVLDCQDGAVLRPWCFFFLFSISGFHKRNPACRRKPPKISFTVSFDQVNQLHFYLWAHWEKVKLATGRNMCPFGWWTRLDGLWFIQYSWSPPDFLCFSKSSTWIRMTRPQMSCQATTLGDSEWVPGFSPSLSSDLQSLWRETCFWLIIILNKYLSSGQRQNGLVVNPNVNRSTQMRRSFNHRDFWRSHLVMKHSRQASLRGQ